MSEPFCGEIQMFAGNFAPRGWAFCDGQLLSVNSNQALFSLLGTVYGGDGRTTFGLPDLRGRLPLHAGSGPGLTPRKLGAKAGIEKVTLTNDKLPSHTHDYNGNTAAADVSAPAGKVVATTAVFRFYKPVDPTVNMAGSAIGNTGGSGSHTNLMPALCINFIIALVGIYPSRN